MLIADISGYTVYLTQSELQHAQEVLQSLLELLVEHTRPPLVLSRLEGDAVISYALEETAVQGQTFVELIENTYVDFRRAIELMVLNNTCQCNACANVSALDLKFFLHHGAFGIQRLGGHDELVGSDVILIHRLLKNRVVETTGVRAYALYTDAAITFLRLEDYRQKLTAHEEDVEHLGSVRLWLQDIHPVWEARRAEARTVITADQTLLQVEADISMSSHLVWDYLLHPQFRATLLGSDREHDVLNRKHGRIAPGTVFHCYHGEKVTRQAILAWHPFEQMTTEDFPPLPIPNTSVVNEFRLIPTARGTRLVQTMGKGGGPLPGRLLTRLVVPTMKKAAQRDIDAFAREIEADLAGRMSRTSNVRK